jgi:hypothetical protein
MSQPQQKSNLLPLILAFVVVGVVGLLIWQFWLEPLQAYNSQLNELTRQKLEKLKQIEEGRKERAARDRFEMLSLPSNPDQARLKYQRYLEDLVARHHIDLTSGVLTPTGTKEVMAVGAKQSAFGTKKDDEKDRAYTTLAYRLDGQASLAHLAGLLRDFEDTPLLHRIKSMTVKPVDQDPKKGKKKDGYQVNVQMELEAVIVAGGNRRAETLIGPDDTLIELNALTFLNPRAAGLALVPWAVGPGGLLSKALIDKHKAGRDYSVIDRKNIFLGYKKPPPEPVDPGGKDDEYTFPPGMDMRDFFRLVAITKTDEVDEALLYCVAKGTYMKLKTTPGYRLFKIYDSNNDKLLIDAKVLRIDYGVVYFEQDEQVYGIHAGETLKEAVKTPIPESELTKIGLKLAKGP